MGFRLLPMMISNAKHIYKLQSALTEKKRFVVPITYLNHPSFSEIIKARRRWILVSSFNGRSNNTMQRRCICWCHFSIEHFMKSTTTYSSEFLFFKFFLLSSKRCELMYKAINKCNIYQYFLTLKMYSQLFFFRLNLFVLLSFLVRFIKKN